MYLGVLHIFLPDFFLVFLKKSLLSDLIPASGDFSGNNQFWTQIKPEKLSCLIWILTVCHSDHILENIFLKNIVLIEKKNKKNVAIKKIGNTPVYVLIYIIATNFLFEFQKVLISYGHMCWLIEAFLAYILTPFPPATTFLSALSSTYVLRSLYCKLYVPRSDSSAGFIIFASMIKSSLKCT